MARCEPNQRKRHSASLRLGIACLVLCTAAGPATQPAHTPFITTLLKDWYAWDRNGDGTLAIDEIDRAVRDPSVKGDDAAAVATLKLLSQNKKLVVPLPPLTKAYFAEYETKALALRRQQPGADSATRPAAAEAATIDTVNSAATTRPAARTARLPADWDLYFAASRARIARGGPVAFPGRFVLDHTRQGPLGDCYFVAAVGAMVARDPARLNAFLKQTDDGKFRVSFPDTPVVTMAPLTDAELAISSTTAGDGVWLALLEQGFGRGKSQIKAGTDDVEGVDEIKNGGSTSASIKLLTGHPAQRIPFSRTLESRKSHADKLLPQVRSALTAAFADGRMVLASVHPPETAPTTQQLATRPSLGKGTLPTIPPNINTKHAYAVLAYDAKTDVVSFWNPHGQLFHPVGTPGIEHGYPTEHGRFDVPLTEAYLFFSTFAIERPAGSTTGPAQASIAPPAGAD